MPDDSLFAAAPGPHEITHGYNYAPMTLQIAASLPGAVPYVTQQSAPLSQQYGGSFPPHTAMLTSASSAQQAQQAQQAQTLASSYQGSAYGSEATRYSAALSAASAGMQQQSSGLQQQAGIGNPMYFDASAQLPSQGAQQGQFVSMPGGGAQQNAGLVYQAALEVESLQCRPPTRLV